MVQNQYETCTDIPANLKRGQFPSAKVENRLRARVGRARGRRGIELSIGQDGGLIISGPSFSGTGWVGNMYFTKITTNGKRWLKITQEPGQAPTFEGADAATSPCGENEDFIDTSIEIVFRVPRRG